MPTASQTHSIAPPADRPRRPVSTPAVCVGVVDGSDGHAGLLETLRSLPTWCVEDVQLEGENDFGALKGFDVVILLDPPAGVGEEDERRRRQRQTQLELLSKRRIGALVLTDRSWFYAGYSFGLVTLPLEAPAEKVQGVLIALAHMRPLLRQLDQQLSAMQRLGRSMQKQLTATDHELHLAERLQRDFLPKDLPKSGPLRFTTLFRPCSWVSGDIFDVFRLDEAHWGFYLADAVGHGVAAGLLTMYIKHAIRPKRILRQGYKLARPSEVLNHLNELLISQGLPDSQFITAWYGLMNVERMMLHYSVAGHPAPLLINPRGEIRELHGEGCVLGISTGEVFEDEAVSLKPGDRVMVFSDGLEETLIARRPQPPAQPVFEKGIPELLRLPADDFLERLRERLDNTPGSLSQPDDVTALVVDVQPDRAATR